MSPQRCVRCTRCTECAVQLSLVNRCIYWSMKASSAPRLTNNYAKLAWVIPKFTKWALRSKTCLLSFRPSTLLNDKRPHDETQTFSRVRRNFVQGIHCCRARSADSLLLFLSAADRDGCV